MSETTTLATIQQPGEINQFELLQRQCRAFVRSGFLPDHIVKNCDEKTAVAKAVTIAIKGHELGIPPMQAFASITVIKGKPCLSAELMLALAYSKVKGAKITFRTPPDKQAQECTVTMQRPGGDPMDFRFTMQDAQNAGLLKSDSAWQKYPAAMLRARAVSAGARAVFPDAVMGCYTPEEIGGAPIEIEGEVMESTAQALTIAPQGEVVSVTTNGGTGTGPSRPLAPEHSASSSWEHEPASEAQIKRLYALGKEFGYDHTQLKDLALLGLGKSHLNELTKGEIQVAFKKLEHPTKGSVAAFAALGAVEK